MTKYVALGIKTKREAESLKRKAQNDGFKGVKIFPYISYKEKKPNHYDITYESVNPLTVKIKETKNDIIEKYFRDTPKGLKRLSTSTYPKSRYMLKNGKISKK